MRYSDFWAVEDWQILESKVCHFFNESETVFEAINVQIGILTVHKMTIHGSIIEKHPITRWITSQEYRRLKENCGVVVF